MPRTSTTSAASRATEISRFRLHRMKARYWRDRLKLGKVNHVIESLEERLGGPEAAKSDERYRRLLEYRMRELGRVNGIRDVFAQFGLSLNRDETPIVTEEHIMEVTDETWADAGAED